MQTTDNSNNLNGHTPTDSPVEQAVLSQKFHNPIAVTVPLTRGYHALVDLADYDLVSALKWRAKVDPDGRVYAYTDISRTVAGKGGATISMHRLLMDARPGEKVDHRDGDGLNNRRKNLRRCTNAQNIRNQGKHRGKHTSTLKGVYRMRDGRYRAQIMVSYRKINLGDYIHERDAAIAYDEAARKLHGEFARTNFAERAA